MSDTPADEAGNIRIVYTILEAARGLLTKKIWVNDSGTLEKHAAASPSRGTFTHCEHEGIAEEIMAAFAETSRRLNSRQAIIASPLPSPLAPNGSKWPLRLADESETENTLPRARKTFQAAKGHALGFLDFDVPAPLRPHIGSPEELYEKILLPAWPGFADVALLIRPSVSSGACLANAPAPLPTGFHCFFVISKGEQLGQLAEALFARLVLGGHAVVEASRRGSMLRRAILDVSASKGPERLIFEADPVIIGEGVERVEREPVCFPGDVLDADAAIAALALSASDQRKMEALWTLAEERARADCETAHEAWLQVRAVEIQTERNVAPEQAQKAAKHEAAAFDAGDLTDDFRIQLDDGSSPTVYEILSNPDHYKSARGYSLDEPTPRRGVSFVWPYYSKADPAAGKPEGPYLSSFEHGGRFWRLRSPRLADEHQAQAERHSKAANKDTPSLYQLTDWNPWDRTGGSPFPFDTLHPVVRDWTETQAALTGADPSAFAMAAFHIVSGCIDHRVRLRPKQHERNYLIGPALWTLLVGLPSTIKSAVVRSVSDPLRKFDHHDREDRERIFGQERMAGNDSADKETPPARIRIISDVTVEAVTQILSEQDCGITLIRDELSGWLNGMDRYAGKGGKGGAERPFWLEAKNGGTYNVNRMKSSRNVNVLSASVFGGIQPDKLNDIDSQTADGFLQRFIVLNMSHAGPEQDIPIDPRSRALFERMANDVGRIPPTVFTFTPEAREYYLQFSNQMRNASRTIIPNEAFGTFVGKQAHTLGTLALLLHIMDIALDGGHASEDGYPPIPRATLERAQQIVEEFILPQAEFFYASTVRGLDKVLSIAGAIIKLAGEGVSQASARELGRRSRAIRDIQSDIGKIRLALTPFIINGWLTPQTLLPDNNRWFIQDLAGRFRSEMKRQDEAHEQLQRHMRKQDRRAAA